MLFLVISDNNYWERVPVQIGTQVIDHLVVTMTEKELQQAGKTWKQVNLSTLISNRNTMKGLNVPEYDLKGVKGEIHTIREVSFEQWAFEVKSVMQNHTEATGREGIVWSLCGAAADLV